MQLQLEKSKIKLILKEFDEIENEQDLKSYLDTLELSELLEIYYIQLSEISRIRKIFLDSVRDRQQNFHSINYHLLYSSRINNSEGVFLRVLLKKI